MAHIQIQYISLLLKYVNHMLDCLFVQYSYACAS